MDPIATPGLTFLFVVAVIIGVAAVTALLVRGRLLLPIVLLFVFGLLLLYAVPVLYVGVEAPTSETPTLQTPVYFVYGLAFFALLVVIYPATLIQTHKERLRTAGLALIVALVLLMAVPAMATYGVPYIPVSLAFIVTVMATYTIGAIVLGTYAKQDRRSLLVGSKSARSGVVRSAQQPLVGTDGVPIDSRPGWGASTFWHLLEYIPMGLLIGAQDICTSADTLTGFVLVSFILACGGALGALDEAERWAERRISPLNAIDSVGNAFPTLMGVS